MSQDRFNMSRTGTRCNGSRQTSLLDQRRVRSATAGKTVFRNPGIHNWDMALFKIVPLGSGAKGPQLQFRWEAYNVFNHTQYATVDTTARFNPAGEQINATFGRITSTRPPRQMQASIRVQF